MFWKSRKTRQLESEIDFLTEENIKIASTLKNAINTLLILKQQFEITLYLLFDSKVITEDRFNSQVEEFNRKVFVQSKNSFIANEFVKSDNGKSTSNELNDIVQQILLSKQGDA